ncbi:carbonate dehydratase [Aquisalimonas asiatica]|uniref:Carbonic anhydrase n=1 Tax=Aquisalimonas asiatica TaxID=406100 RepID=A0A1H8RMI9_9GAMM|nr:carbonic anhydrase [Aquisalimonas asiatica]
MENNRLWSERMQSEDPEFFRRLATQQSPDYLWIGCSDSRAPANQIVGLKPGELFVHRNIANVVTHTDMNCMAVLQFAVKVLKVRHIIVCGHYNCGGVRAALGHAQFGMIDSWLRHIKDIYDYHRLELEALPSEEEQVDRLCELNVSAQVQHVCSTTIVQNAWARGQSLAVHGWVYQLQDGLINDLGVTVRSPDEVPQIYRMNPEE